jgi:hypothetical protein
VENVFFLRVFFLIIFNQAPKVSTNAASYEIIIVESPFESWNGLIGMNRDVLMKLIKAVSKTRKAEEKIRNVLHNSFFIIFYFIPFLPWL